MPDPQQLAQSVQPSQILSLLESPFAFIERHPLWLVGTLGVGTLLVSDYTAWVNYGTGGFPSNPAVYLFMCCVRAGRFITQKYGRSASGLLKAAAKLDKDRQARTLSELKTREEPRPTVIERPLPHRQYCQVSTAVSTGEITDYFQRIAAANPTLLATATSNLEGQGPALFVAGGSSFPEGKAAADAWGKGEIAHLHPQDASLHVVLGPLDAAEVVAKNWGERFPLAGALGRVPEGYVMLYAPRSAEEIKIVKRVLLASCRFLAGREVNAVGDE